MFPLARPASLPLPARGSSRVPKRENHCCQNQGKVNASNQPEQLHQANCQRSSAANKPSDLPRHPGSPCDPSLLCSLFPGRPAAPLGPIPATTDAVKLPAVPPANAWSAATHATCLPTAGPATQLSAFTGTPPIVLLPSNGSPWWWDSDGLHSHNGHPMLHPQHKQHLDTGPTAG